MNLLGSQFHHMNLQRYFASLGFVQGKPDYGRISRKKNDTDGGARKKGKIWTNKLGIPQKTKGTKKCVFLCNPKKKQGFPGTVTLLQRDPHRLPIWGSKGLRILCCSNSVDLL